MQNEHCYTSVAVVSPNSSTSHLGAADVKLIDRYARSLLVKRRKKLPLKPAKTDIRSSPPAESSDDSRSQPSGNTREGILPQRWSDALKRNDRPNAETPLGTRKEGTPQDSRYETQLYQRDRRSSVGSVRVTQS